MQIVNWQETIDNSAKGIDRKAIKRGGVSDYIIRLLTKSSFRLGPLTEEVLEYVSSKVDYCVRNSLPIRFLPTTGSYKNIYAPSAPHSDWAEVFQLEFLLNNLLSIAAFYEPGIVVEYSGDTYTLCFIDNLKDEWIQIYNEEFDKILERVGSVVPRNCKLILNNAENFYDMKELESKVAKLVAQANLDDPEIVKLIDKSKDHAINNICWDGREDWSRLSDEERDVKLKRSVLMHKYWLELDFKERKDYLLADDTITVVHRTDVPDSLPVYSAKGCDVQYWEGVGVIKESSSCERHKWVVSPKQLEGLHVVEELDVDDFAAISPELESIKVVKQTNKTSNR
ncbi:hypothetical protein KC614_01055 [candidate division WWE3 bacterium]|uniref:Uncharacterized protein n=1 Tax=candidate division WWE3 bacterium TaxID=2053526 RepID=A0A955LJU2_UNCKA|nr:hypothetical protein [candidate division WWE3 bacterium]